MLLYLVRLQLLAKYKRSAVAVNERSIHFFYELQRFVGGVARFKTRRNTNLKQVLASLLAQPHAAFGHFAQSAGIEKVFESHFLVQIDAALRVKVGQLAHADYVRQLEVVPASYVVATLWNSSEKWSLTAFEASCNFAALSCFLTFLPLAASFAFCGTVASAKLSELKPCSRIVPDVL